MNCDSIANAVHGILERYDQNRELTAAEAGLGSGRAEVGGDVDMGGQAGILCVELSVNGKSSCSGTPRPTDISKGSQVMRICS